MITLIIGSYFGINAIRSLYSHGSPQVYESLLVDRERYMAERILEISREHDRTVVVTGAAHMTGLKEEIERIMPEAKIEMINFFDL